MLETLNRILPLPYPHFMAFAPLDAWWRLLTRDKAYAKIPPRYYPRVAGGLFTSCLGTALTLPERLLLAPFLPTTRSTLPTPPLFILGYYRSGTTHLHYLLSCDPNLATPRWHQMIAPQGFILSWTFLRFFLVPFLSSKRPQDDVAYGPEYPAEDDFGVCNWSAACSLPGRIALPQCWGFYSRFHGLGNLSPPELARFHRAQLGISWKLGKLNPGRTLLFKTPSHTARVAELARLYPRAKFIHLHRDPRPVLRSNVAMNRRLTPHFLQPHPGDEEIRRRVIAEYDATERKFLAESADIAPDRIVRVRYEDLIADPIGQVKIAYDRLGLPFTPEFARRAMAYLDSVRDYRAAPEKSREAMATASVATDRDAEELAWMHAAFGHDRPAAAPRDPAMRIRELGILSNTPSVDPLAEGERIDRDESEGPLLNAWTGPLVTAAFCFAAWLLVAAFSRDRMDWLAWPSGVAIGLAALRTGRRGTALLGMWALALTLVVILATALPATWLSVRDRFSPVNLSHHVWLAARRGVMAWNNLLWIGLGLMTAYRFASRQHVRPPGM
jgi:hypothetical protein